MSDARATVFVVDDEISVRESIKLLVESAGWRIECNGFESTRVV
jgi:FixJ family two-component response regulator